jgi:hypothetical protein
MSTYNLSQTAAEIDSAINKVHNADTTPTQGSTSMVTSGGVYTAVNNIGASALPITTEAQGIANYDNDAKVPTNAAVIDYVTSATVNNSQTVLSRSSDWAVTSESWHNIPSVTISGVNPDVVWNGSKFVISAGVYYYYVQAEITRHFRIYAMNIGEFREGSLVNAEAGTPSINKEIIGFPSGNGYGTDNRSYRQTTGLCYFPTATSLYLQIRDDPSYNTVTARIRNLQVHFIKLGAA